jgi:hypothetical protein
MQMKPFKIDLNLDDEEERDDFIASIEAAVVPAAKATKLLNLTQCPGTFDLARALCHYAYTKRTAVDSRKKGLIQQAQMLEQTCDRIYSQSIQPVCECW